MPYIELKYLGRTKAKATRYLKKLFFMTVDDFKRRFNFDPMGYWIAFDTKKWVKRSKINEKCKEKIKVLFVIYEKYIDIRDMEAYVWDWTTAYIELDKYRNMYDKLIKVFRYTDWYEL